jgi:aspartyl protease family protein
MNRLTLLLAILAIGLALLIFNHGSGQTFGMNNDDFGRLVALAALVTLLSAGILRISARRCALSPSGPS